MWCLPVFWHLQNQCTASRPHFKPCSENPGENCKFLSAQHSFHLSVCFERAAFDLYELTPPLRLPSQLSPILRKRMLFTKRMQTNVPLEKLLKQRSCLILVNVNINTWHDTQMTYEYIYKCNKTMWTEKMICIFIIFLTLHSHGRQCQHLSFTINGWCHMMLKLNRLRSPYSNNILQVLANCDHAWPENNGIGCCNNEGRPRWRHVLRQALTLTPRVNAGIQLPCLYPHLKYSLSTHKFY